MHASETRTPRRPRRRLLLQVGLSLAGAMALTAALLPGSGSAVALVPPNNTGEPSIVGDAIEGRTLTANRGTWSGTTPMSFAYRWLRCPTDGGAADGSNCAPIGGSAGAGTTYRLRDADVGIRIRVRVTATNADGSDTAVSNPTAIVQGSAETAEHRATDDLRLAGARRDADGGPGHVVRHAADHVHVSVAELQLRRRQLLVDHRAPQRGRTWRGSRTSAGRCASA